MSNSRHKIFFWATFIGLFILTAGCAMVNMPSEKEYEMIRSGKRSLVLLRIACNLDEMAYEVFSQDLMDDNFGIALGSFETGGEMKQVMTTFLSNQARKDGWIYFILEPGYYYFAIQPPRRTDAWTYASNFDSIPLQKFYIPPKTQVIYVGTLYFECMGKKGLLGSSIISSCDRDSIIIKKEEDAASKLALEFFSEFEAPNTRLMEKHNGPKIFEVPTIRK
jgi:hypothetical protein